MKLLSKSIFECFKYIVKENKMTKFIIDELEISSDDSYEEVSDERFVTKNRLKLNIMIMAH